VYYDGMTAMQYDDVPVYLRLRAMIAMAILEGTYREGAQLPSVRAFAAETGTNPLTVAKAYQDDAFITVKRGVGMFVATGALLQLRTKERDQFLTRVWPLMRRRIDSLGITIEDLFDSETLHGVPY
jgi:GntR family transcriptional regulator